MYQSSRLSLIIIVIAKKIILSAFSVYFGILRICFPCFLGIIFIVLHYLVDAQKVPSYLPSHLSSSTPPRRFLPTFLPSLLPSLIHYFLSSFLPPLLPPLRRFLPTFLHSFLPSLPPGSSSYLLLIRS